MKNLKQPAFLPLPCYKFYKYLKCEDGLKVLTLGTLKYTKPTEFNDPFDCYPYLPDKGFKKFYKRLLDDYANGQKLPNKVMNKNLAALRATGKNGDLHKLLSQRLAITCFSDNPLSVPMWAHYAEEHEGCVIEFQISEAIADKIARNDPGKKLVRPRFVNYTDDRPPLYNKDGEIDGYSQIYTKSMQWQYESEVRDFILNEGIHFFSRYQLTKVYVGVRMNDENKKKIKEAVFSLNSELGTKCKIVELGMAFQSYKFVEVK